MVHSAVLFKKSTHHRQESVESRQHSKTIFSKGFSQTPDPPASIFLMLGSQVYEAMLVSFVVLISIIFSDCLILIPGA